MRERGQHGLRGSRWCAAWLAAAFVLGAWPNARLASAAGAPSSSEKEALAIVVTKWNSSCDGSNRPSWDNMIDAWYDDLTDSGSTPGGHGSRAWTRDGF